MNTSTPAALPTAEQNTMHSHQTGGAAIPAARIQALTRPPDCPAVVHLHSRTENATVKHSETRFMLNTMMNTYAKL